jgi:hypothetical protein
MAALAWAPACSACAAMAPSHATWGAAEAAIDADAGPCHAPPVSPEITDAWSAAVEYSSAASLSQTAAAACIDPGPGPAYIRPELISGDSSAKSIAITPAQPAAITLAASVAAYEPALVAMVFANISWIAMA